MRKFGNWIIGGIRQKVFNLVLFTIVLMMAAYTAVIVWQSSHLSAISDESSVREQEAIAETVRQAMDERLTASLGEATQLEAYIVDDMFADVASSLEAMASYAEEIFANPSAYPARQVSLPDASTDGQVTVQLLIEAGVDINDPAIAEQIGLVGNMGDMLSAFFQGTQIDSCYIALPSGVMVLADDHASSKLDESGAVASIEMTHRPWYTGAVSKRGVYFTDVAADVFSGQVGVMCGVPVYRGDELMAVIGADLMLDDMADSVAGSENEGDFVCIVNKNGHVVFSPKQEGTFKVEESSQATDIRRYSAELAAFVDAALKGSTAPTAVEVDGVEYYLCGAPASMAGWAVINAVSKEATDAVTAEVLDRFDAVVDESQQAYTSSLSNALVTIIVLIVIVMALALVGSLALSRRIVAPLGLITERVKSLGGDNLSFEMDDAYRTGDEVEALAESFAKLSARTLEYVDEVTRVTAEKERVGAELSMATEIQASQLPRLFPAFPDRPEFDVYASMTPAREVGGDFYDFFMVDDDHIALVIADVSDKGVPAALFMMVSRVLIKSHLQAGESPAEALGNVNDQLSESNEAGLFVTVWAAVLEISTGKAVVANAGHERPVLCRAGGRYELVVYRHSPVVGMMEGIFYREHEVVLRPGDSLFVYTDGLAEATNAENEQLGTDRMLGLLNEDPDANPDVILANVQRGVDDFVGEAEQFDDLTMLCFRYIGPSAS